MKTIKISDVHFQMLLTESKKYKIKPDALVEELIEETYASKARRR